jgi:hypothetical protein
MRRSSWTVRRDSETTFAFDVTKKHNMMRRDGKGRITINDFFKARDEAKLTGKLLGFNEDKINKIYECLRTDMMVGARRYHRDIRHGWNLTLEKFSDLAPVFKSQFENCTRENMALLLLETREGILKLKYTDKNRHLRREYLYNYGRRGEHRDVMSTVPPGSKRLFPKSNSFYTDYLGVVALKRFGVVAIRTLRVMYSEDDNLKGYMAPRFRDGRIAFISNGKALSKFGWIGESEVETVMTPNKLIKLNLNWRKKDKNGKPIEEESDGD